MDENSIAVKAYKDGNINSTDTNNCVTLTKGSSDGNYSVLTGTDVSENSDTSKTNCTFEVKFTDLKKIEGLDSKSIIVVTYSATINGSATAGGEGNKNSVKLEYSNDPNNTGTGTTKPDEVSVFTFKLDITKVKKGETDTKLAGAKFVLSTDKNLKIDVTESDADLSEDVKNHLIKVTGTTPNYVINDGTKVLILPHSISWEETADGNESRSAEYHRSE